MEYKLIHGNSLDELKKLKENSIDAVVTDPPYEIGFMGKGWDNTGIANNKLLWAEVLRVLKPGGHMLAFSGTRTYHRMVCAIEDAGFEIRDQLAWIYGSGFPKSQNIGKAIDKQAGAKRKVVGSKKLLNDFTVYATSMLSSNNVKDRENRGTEAVITAPATDNAKKYDGWGTALKPAQEPIVLARKPIAEKTIAANVIKHGTGGINIDGCRVEHKEDLSRKLITNGTISTCYNFKDMPRGSVDDNWKKGRWPANLLHDGSDEVLEVFPDTGKGTGKVVHQKRIRKGFNSNIGGSGWANVDEVMECASPDNYGDGGSAARFFYSAKCSKIDRNEGCEDMPKKGYHKNKPPTKGTGNLDKNDWDIPDHKGSHNNHPTVKPTNLMRYLIKLITPINGTVLDPFMGSGSTGKACMLENKNFIGIDLTKEYITIADKRIAHAKKQYEDGHATDEFFDTEEEDTEEVA